MKQYTVDYFIQKFEAIPKRKWTTGIKGTARFIGEPKCALGHCGSSTEPVTPEAVALTQLLEPLGVPVWAINDASSAHYDYDNLYRLGKTPKERILNALLLIKAGVKV